MPPPDGKLESLAREWLQDVVRDAVREVLHEERAQSSAWSGCVKLAEAAKLAGGVSVSTIEKWGREGLPIHKRGHVRVVEIDQLRDFLRRRETTKTSSDEEWAKNALATVTRRRA